MHKYYIRHHLVLALWQNIHYSSCQPPNNLEDLNYEPPYLISPYIKFLTHIHMHVDVVHLWLLTTKKGWQYSTWFLMCVIYIHIVSMVVYTHEKDTHMLCLWQPLKYQEQNNNQLSSKMMWFKHMLWGAQFCPNLQIVTKLIGTYKTT